MNSSIAVTLLCGFALLYEAGLVALYVNALARQPKRLKARIGFCGNVVFLAFEVCAFAFRSDALSAPLFVPIALIMPALASISAYRLYRRWDPKYWDPSAPDFLGWNQA